jgi:hypothetical protein
MVILEEDPWYAMRAAFINPELFRAVAPLLSRLDTALVNTPASDGVNNFYSKLLHAKYNFTGVHLSNHETGKHAGVRGAGGYIELLEEEPWETKEGYQGEEPPGPANNLPTVDEVDETGLDPEEIDIIVAQTNCSRARAAKALRKHGDMIDAILVRGFVLSDRFSPDNPPLSFHRSSPRFSTLTTMSR